MNRRGFLASFAAAALVLKAEPVCAWCKGRGWRAYSDWKPGRIFDPVRMRTFGPCDACGDPERALWVPGAKLISVPKARGADYFSYRFDEWWKFTPGGAVYHSRDDGRTWEPFAFVSAHAR